MQNASQKYFKVKQVLNWANLLTAEEDVKEQMQSYQPTQNLDWCQKITNMRFGHLETITYQQQHRDSNAPRLIFSINVGACDVPRAQKTGFFLREVRIMIIF